MLDKIVLGVQNIAGATFTRVSQVIPEVILAVIFIIIGWVIGHIVKWVVVKIVENTRVDEWIEEQNLSHAIGGHTLAVILGSIAKWSIVAVVLAEAARSLKMEIIGGILINIAVLVFQVLFLLLIVIAGLLFARYIRNVIEITTHRFRKTAGIAAEVVIIYLAAIIGFQTTGLIDVTILVQIFIIAFTAICLTAAIVIGISFGFAMRDEAKHIVRDFEKSSMPKKKKKK